MRGIDKRQEIDPTMLIRDTRTIGQRVHDFFEIPSYVGIIVLTTAGGSFLFPGLSDALF
jgi:intracellular multiplication protein IcmO